MGDKANAELAMNQAHEALTQATSEREQCHALLSTLNDANSALSQQTEEMKDLINLLNNNIECLQAANKDQGCQDLQASLSESQTNLLRVVEFQARAHSEHVDEIRALLEKIMNDQQSELDMHNAEVETKTNECADAVTSEEEKSQAHGSASNTFDMASTDLTNAEEAHTAASNVYEDGVALQDVEAPVLEEVMDQSETFCTSYNIPCPVFGSTSDQEPTFNHVAEGGACFGGLIKAPTKDTHRNCDRSYKVPGGMIDKYGQNPQQTYWIQDVHDPNDHPFTDQNFGTLHMTSNTRIIACMHHCTEEGDENHSNHSKCERMHASRVEDRPNALDPAGGWINDGPLSDNGTFVCWKKTFAPGEAQLWHSVHLGWGYNYIFQTNVHHSEITGM